MIALRGKGTVSRSQRLWRRNKKRKNWKIETHENERRRSNLQIFKKKDLKKKKDKTYIHGYNGEEKWNDNKKKEKETVLTIDFKMKKRIRWRRWGKKKDAAFFDPDSFCFLLLVCTHYDLSQFIVLSMKYCNKNTVNYS